MNVQLNGSRITELESLMYLAVNFSSVGRMSESRKMTRTLKNASKKRNVATEAKMRTYSGIIVPSVLHGIE